MRFLICFIILFQVSSSVKANKEYLKSQLVSDSLIKFKFKEPDGSPHIYYYPFYDGVQMIEVDYLSPYHERVNYLEQAQPRALTWEMVLGPPHPNVYLFRNAAGEIVKQIGAVDEKIKLLSVRQSKEVLKPHNSFVSKIGASLGFSNLSTRYFPYYLIGRNAQNHSGGNLGLIDSLGNQVLAQEYDFIWQRPDCFITVKRNTNELRDRDLKLLFSSETFSIQPAYRVSGYIVIKNDDKLGLLNMQGEIVLPCKYSMILGGFNELGLMEVRDNGRIGFVDRNWKEVIKCKYQSVGEFSEGLLNARLHEKWGYINKEGKTIIPHRYQIGINFYEGLARVAKKEDGGYYFGFINTKGEEVIPLIYSNAKDFKGGKAEVMIDNKWVKINQRGERVR